ncbi:MAG: DUF427 domain-containing protein [Candidatus Bathyarchaeia archaeon]
MAKATWNNVVIAESFHAVLLEGNVYFPPEALKKEYFKPSETHSNCSWKGQANYYDIEVKGKRNKDAAWYYSEPKETLKNIKGYVAFWHGVEIEVGGTAPEEQVAEGCCTWES